MRIFSRNHNSFNQKVEPWGKRLIKKISMSRTNSKSMKVGICELFNINKSLKK